jgi:hypothetical protein
MNDVEDISVIRFPAKSELEVSSIDRYENQFAGFLNKSPSNNILFPARQSLLAGYFTRIALCEVQLKWRTPNINLYNDIFSYLSLQPSGLQSFTIQLETDFYTPLQLINRVVALMNLEEPTLAPGNPTYIASYIPSLGGLITKDPLAGRGTLFAILLGNPTLAPETNGARAQKFLQTCGTDPITVLALNNTQQLLERFADVAYTRYIDITSEALSKYSRVKDNMTRQRDGKTSVLARIFLVPFGQKEELPYSAPFTLAVDYNTPKYLRWNPGEFINDFDLSLYDMYGNPLFWDEEYSTEYELNIQASET